MKRGARPKNQRLPFCDDQIQDSGGSAVKPRRPGACRQTGWRFLRALTFRRRGEPPGTAERSLPGSFSPSWRRGSWAKIDTGWPFMVIIYGSRGMSGMAIWKLARGGSARISLRRPGAGGGRRPPVGELFREEVITQETVEKARQRRQTICGSTCFPPRRRIPFFVRHDQSA